MEELLNKTTQKNLQMVKEKIVLVLALKEMMYLTFSCFINYFGSPMLQEPY